MAVVTVRNPGTGEALGEVPTTGAAEVAATVERARRAQRATAATAAHERADLLRRVAGLVEAELPDLARLLAAESGTPIRQTRDELEAAVRIFRGLRGSAGEATGLLGAAPGPERPETPGVVAVLVPFNEPVERYAHQVAAALAAGNAVVVQPPARCPLTVLRITELVEAVGAPRDAHQVVIGGPEVSRQLAELPGIAAVALTGSTAAGREIARLAAGTLKQVHLERGGDDALIVRAGADVEDAARAVVLGRLTRRNGQLRRATQRVYAQAPIHDAFVDALVAQTAKLTVGDQLLESTDVGPLITEEAAGRVLDFVRTLVAAGATLVSGGIRTRAFMDPTVLVDVPATSPAFAEEIFGPAAPVARFDDPAEATRLANAAPYAPPAAIFTRDLSR